MSPLIPLATIGAWGYAGFLCESGPKPAPAPVATTTQTAIKPTPTPTPTSTSPPTSKPQPDPATTPASPSKPVASAPAVPPTRYRLADLTGQVWEHPDPAELRQFVEYRNRSIATAPRFSTPAVGGCAKGRCR